ncbi:MAG TPA: MFS transporter, partial [Promineifilum sp.]|nr:MFS transporter [Promineifilum sp.]
AGASIVGLLPNVVLGPFVGVFVDRWNRRRVMLGADLVVAMTTLLLAYLFWIGAVEIWYVYLALFVRALGGAFHWPAMTASTSLMVPQDQLTRIQGLTAAIAVVATLIVHIPQPESEAGQTADAKSSFSSYWNDLREGLRYVMNWRGLMLLGLVAMLINLVLSPTTSFMPLLVTEYFKGTAWHLGALEAGFGAGVLLGGILLGAWGGFKRRIMTSLVGVIGIGFGILLVGLTPAGMFPIAVLGMLLGGVTSSLANGPIMAIFQTNVAPGMQGRVFTLMGSASAAMMPLGLVLAGPLAESIGVRAWFVIGGIATLLLAISCLFMP